MGGGGVVWFLWISYVSIFESPAGAKARYRYSNKYCFLCKNEGGWLNAKMLINQTANHFIQTLQKSRQFDMNNLNYSIITKYSIFQNFQIRIQKWSGKNTQPYPIPHEFWLKLNWIVVGKKHEKMFSKHWFMCLRVWKQRQGTRLQHVWGIREAESLTLNWYSHSELKTLLSHHSWTAIKPGG